MHIKEEGEKTKIYKMKRKAEEIAEASTSVRREENYSLGRSLRNVRKG